MVTLSSLHQIIKPFFWMRSSVPGEEGLFISKGSKVHFAAGEILGDAVSSAGCGAGGCDYVS
jgi:hypothetical protein